MKAIRWSLFGLAFYGAALPQSWGANTPTYIIVDGPGATATLPFSLNNSNGVTGYYQDASAGVHGFVLSPAGEYTTFDAPGADPVQGTWPWSINAAGTVVGNYVDQNSVSHGFVRSPAGTITTFEVPGSGTEPGGGTFFVVTNDANDLAGRYSDANSAVHGFVRTHAGFTTIDVPDASFLGTWVTGIDNAGNVTGYSWSGSVTIGFVRTASGALTQFAVPDGSNTIPTSINTGGAITGTYINTYGISAGFVRSPSGTLTTFSGPAENLGQNPGTHPTGIDKTGLIVGYYYDTSYGRIRGFVEAPNGSFAAFDAPGAGYGMTRGTYAYGINDSGAITGYYVDSDNNYHGFLRIP
jgi:hypothetical protein